MKEICFIIPTYPPRYDYATNLLQSFREYEFNKQADLRFVFTNNTERNLFPNYEFSVILPNNLQVNNLESKHEKGIVNIKKMFALHQLKGKYKYYIILDDESLFIKNINLLDLCNRFFESKLIYGNKCIDSTLINRPTFSKLKYVSNDEYNKKRIEYILDNLYLRRNNLSIFRGSDLDDFFNKIDYSYSTLQKWEYFEYFEMTYSYYLITYKRWNVIDLGIEAYNSLLEYSGFVTNGMKKKIKKLVALYDFYRSSKNMLPYFDNPKCFIVFHIDRENLRLVSQISRYLYMRSTKSKLIAILTKFLIKIYRCFNKQ